MNDEQSKDLTDFRIRSTATVIDAVARMNKNRSRTIIVMEGDVVIGLVSEGDVIRSLLQGADVHLPIAEIANPSYKFMTEIDHARAFELFRKHLFGLIPIVDNDFHLVDVLTLEDMLARVILSEGD